MPKLVRVAIVVVLVLGGLTAAGWYFFTRGYYQLGMVRAATQLRDPLEPPTAAGRAGVGRSREGEYWQVAKDIRLRHFSVGRGEDVLFLHGGPGLPPSGPLPGLKDLGDSYRVHFYDQRASGRSTRPIDRPTGGNFEKFNAVVKAVGIQEHIADVERIRRLLGKEKIILIGHSFGGFIASLYAAEFPERVRALVLVAPANLYRMPPDKDSDLFRTLRGRLSETDRAEFDRFQSEMMSFGSLMSKSDRELVDLNGRFGSFYVKAQGPDAIPKSIRDLVVPEEGGGWGVQGIYLSLGLRTDLRPALARIVAPTLVLHGAKDMTPESVTRRIASGIRSAQFRVLSGSGHFPHASEPAAFAAIVREFLKGK